MAITTLEDLYREQELELDAIKKALKERMMYDTMPHSVSTTTVAPPVIWKDFDRTPVTYRGNPYADDSYMTQQPKIMDIKEIWIENLMPAEVLDGRITPDFQKANRMKLAKELALQLIEQGIVQIDMDKNLIDRTLRIRASVRVVVPKKE